jgi:hypothetical protein
MTTVDVGTPPVDAAPSAGRSTPPKTPSVVDTRAGGYDRGAVGRASSAATSHSILSGPKVARYRS